MPSADNPADLASRGLLPRLLESANMWFNGPVFLRAPDEEWFDQSKFVAELSAQELYAKICKKIYCTTKTSDSKGMLLRLFARYSFLVTLQRGAARIFRFVGYLTWKCCDNADQTPVGPLSSEELHCPREHNKGHPAASDSKGARQTARVRC